MTSERGQTCASCHRFLPWSAFSPKGERYPGQYHAACKECRARYARVKRADERGVLRRVAAHLVTEAGLSEERARELTLRLAEEGLVR